jgi:hypothetical protein
MTDPNASNPKRYAEQNARQSRRLMSLRIAPAILAGIADYLYSFDDPVEIGAVLIRECVT